MREDSSKNHFFELEDLWNRGVSRSEMTEMECEYSAHQQGYWVDSESRLYTWLVCRGCRPRHLPRDRSLVRAIGSANISQVIGGRETRNPWGPQQYIGD